jgi:3-hydroxyisobutyryl-CoA hydrolase
VDRIKGRPNWEPSELKDVSYSDLISHFFKSSSPYLQNAPLLEVPEIEDSSRTDVTRYGLPSEEEIQQVVTGVHRTSSKKGLDAVQVMKTFQNLYPHKGGLEEKVSEVLARKCDVVDDPGHFQHVRWIY